MTMKRTNNEAFDSMETELTCQTIYTDYTIPAMVKPKAGEHKEFDIKRLKTRFDADSLRQDDPSMYYSIFKFDHDADGITSLLQQNSKCYGADSTVKVHRRSRISVEDDPFIEIVNLMSELGCAKSEQAVLLDSVST
ncbi:hypothetical protein ACHAW6_003802 [Cyclotella cf. meneghiniana]